MHFSNSCPKNTVIASNEQGKEAGKESHNNRGRSASKKPRFRAPSKTNYVEKLPVPSTSSQEPVLPNLPVNTNTHIIPSIVTGQPLLYQPHSPPPSDKMLDWSDAIVVKPPRNDIPDSGVSFNLGIPNLNSPNATASSSSTNLQTQSKSAGKDFVSPNKFDVLNLEGDVKENMVISGDSADNVILISKKVDKEEKLKDLGKSSQQNNTTTAKKPAKGKQGKKTLSKQNS
ncbi:hypothetical protein MA16_Dca019930 [Dendrobium catenatum]|uniref:Uncharacterized protein n=1 Tax=Dendrobium catenatum TaxID=906689 RepID=A0A2I0XEQ7_9ASPA|nr:hypothetical protein MA16_Dca019930 [Dendrobium catenatum]